MYLVRNMEMVKQLKIFKVGNLLQAFSLGGLPRRFYQYWVGAA